MAALLRATNTSRRTTTRGVPVMREQVERPQDRRENSVRESGNVLVETREHAVLGADRRQVVALRHRHERVQPFGLPVTGMASGCASGCLPSTTTSKPCCPMRSSTTSRPLPRRTTRVTGTSGRMRMAWAMAMKSRPLNWKTAWTRTDGTDAQRGVPVAGVKQGDALTEETRDR